MSSSDNEKEETIYDVMKHGEAHASNPPAKKQKKRETNAKIQMLKTQMKYLLHRHRLLEQDIFECEAHSTNGATFRTHAEAIRDCLLCHQAMEKKSSTASFLPDGVKLISLTFPNRSESISGEESVNEYIEAVNVQRETVMKHCTTLSIPPNQCVTLVGESAVLMKCILIIQGSASSSLNVMVMMKLSKEKSQAEDNLSQPKLSEETEYHLELSTNVLNLFSTLNEFEIAGGTPSSWGHLQEMPSNGMNTIDPGKYSPTIIFPEGMQQTSLIIGADVGSVSSNLSPISSTNVNNINFSQKNSATE